MGDFIIMAWLLALGVTPHSSLDTSGRSINASNCLVQTLGVGFYLADHVHIYSTVEIRETKSNSVYFDPFRSDFLIGGSVYFDNLSIGIAHECNHDIVTNTNFHAYNGWEAGFNTAYINYTMPFSVSSGLTITPSIMLGDQFAETVRIKSGDIKQYFNTRMAVSPNILFSGFKFEIEYFYLRTCIAFQAGYAFRNNAWAYTQFRLGMELFYENISLGLDYTRRDNLQKDAGYALEDLTLFIRFRGKSNLL
jgi:hypothetical protein